MMWRYMPLMCLLGLLGCATAGGVTETDVGSMADLGSTDAGTDTSLDAAASDAVVPDMDGGATDAEGAPVDDAGADMGRQPGRDPDAGPAPGPSDMRPLPDESAVVRQLAADRPDLLAESCVARGGNTAFLFELVRRLRAIDPRWGLNWKRGNVGDLSLDVVDYFWAPGEPVEGRTEVYIVRVIANHCPVGDEPPAGPAWIDLTQATVDAGAIGRWTVSPLDGAPGPGPAPDPGGRVPLPDESAVVDRLADEQPDLLAQSCVEQGGNNAFLFELVRRLRAIDQRWGLNWKRGNVGDLSQDIVDYYYGPGAPQEDSTDVYIIDIISGHCPGPNDPPSGTTWIDQTQATADGGTIGRWTLRPLQ